MITITIEYNGQVLISETASNETITKIISCANKMMATDLKITVTDSH